MDVIFVKQSKASYFADFVFYPLAAVLLSCLLYHISARGQRLDIAGSIAGGLLAWSLIEYGIHRFVLHGIEPFRSWHARHHGHPQDWIGTPTLFSAALIVILIFLPVLLVGGIFEGTGFTLGIVIGYSGYVCAHYFVHHKRVSLRWLQKRKAVHAMHHRRGNCLYGVTTSLWDNVFGTAS